MSAVFQNERHERAYHAVLKCLRGIGYTRHLIQEGYEFNDWFAANAPKRQVCAAFGQTPFSYDSACFAVLPTLSHNQTSDIVTNYRALGAPLAIEVREDCIIPWRVGRTAQTTDQFAGRIPLNAIESMFKRRESEWNPEAILRAKNIGLAVGPRQLDFVDLGLIPALEEEISQKLHALLNEAINEAQAIYRKRTGRQPDVQQLFRLVFRLLAGRVLHDRAIAGFRHVSQPPDPAVILARVNDYYGETLPVLQDRAAQQAALERLWNGFSFQNLSVDILAYVYENTLVDPITRQQLGIHSTPRSIARYIVNRLPFEDIPLDQRVVVEPCSGHGVFLVAALKRLRDLLPANMDGQARHRYFVKMLRGFEIDAFALEVSRLCLTLADFPNQNGWRLKGEDVFTSTVFERQLQRGRIVLCNPPFENFSKDDIQRQHGIAQKPVAILKKVLTHLPKNGLLGFVLPRYFISGNSYREMRQILAERFAEIEIVALPDRMFRHALLETCLLLGKLPKTEETKVAVAFSEVKDKDRERFLSEYIVSRGDREEKTIQESTQSIAVLPLNEIWERLKVLPKLGDIADIHRGVEWKQPFDQTKYVSITQKPGFVKGVNSAAGEFQLFSKPKPIFLAAKSEWQRGGAWHLPWNRPKVVMNAVRVSRGPWKIAAFVDENEIRYTANFTCFWLKTPRWTPKTLAALLNSPIAAAFVAAKETAKHILKVTLNSLPIPPQLSPEQARTIEGLVDDYLAAVRDGADSDLELWSTSRSEPRARRILLQIDAEILRCYDLPPRLERKLLDFFRNEKRPVPFDFGNYFPDDFTPTIPLWRFISRDFSQCNGPHLLELVPKVTDPALINTLEEIE
jgi:type I restriction-modification system DNA methylase subunit